MVGQGQRRGGSKKTPAKPTTDSDDSFIVFSNSKDNVKAKKEGLQGATGSSQNGVSASQPGGSDAPKKQDTRKLIGGASWTGKLPVNLLSEHCQKQKWEKPEYTMVRLFGSGSDEEC